MQTIAGLATARGFASGPVFIYRGDGIVQVPEYLVEPGCEASELARLRRARAETRRDLENLISVLRERTGRDDVKVFECHLLILEDVMLVKEAESYIADERMNAAAAVRRTSNAARAKFERMNDPYFRERVRDLDDVERRLLGFISGFSGNPHLELKSPAIVVADDLTPSEAVQLPRDMVLGFALNGGSTTSHVALLARALGIPAVCGLGNITSLVKPGELVLLDGANGAVTINPNASSKRDFEELVECQRELSEAFSIGKPAGTLKDGEQILIQANMHPGVPVVGLKENGARGVGLYRSEYLWLDRELEPSEEEQFEEYREAAKLAAMLDADASIVIRMLDIGGDKTVRGISTKEANPFLGNRSIRYLLSNPTVFKTQLRAILRASVFGKVKIMYPMVSCLEELRAASAIFDEVKASLDTDGIDYDRDIEVGAMIEVPAAALNADSLARHVKFFSIGTNDLIQYTLAADRGNDAVAHLYQPLNPAVIKLVRMTIDAAKRNGIKVSVCGESASDPLVGALWVAMGVDVLSMSPSYIPLISKLLSMLTRADLDEYARVIESLGNDITADEIAAECHRWMVAKLPDFDSILI